MNRLSAFPSIIIFILVFISITSQSAQSYAQDTSYFPHALGNTWVYQDDEGRITKKVVTRDSIDEKGYVYVHLDNDFMEKWTYMLSPHKDSVFLWSSVRMFLLYKFPVSVGERWKVDTIGGMIALVGNVTSGTLFGVQTTYIPIGQFRANITDSLKSVDWYKTQHLAKGFGLVYEGREEGYNRLIGCIIDGKKYGYILDVEEDNSLLPNTIALYQNYPNPFNPGTIISFSLPHYEKVELKIFDIIGREIKTLIDDFMAAGKHSIMFETENISSGLYLYRLKAGPSVITKKMLYLK